MLSTEADWLLGTTLEDQEEEEEDDEEAVMEVSSRVFRQSEQDCA